MISTTSGDRTLMLPSGDGQDDLGSLDLEPGQGTAMGGGVQRIRIPPGDRQFLRSSPPHRSPPRLMEPIVSIGGPPNSLQVLRAPTLGPARDGLHQLHET